MADTHPLVSIIIPTYNRADLLPETLDSIIAQTYSHWECIVVDDGSEDNTLEVLSDYEIKDNRITYLQRSNEDIKGVNHCRKLGFLKSKGDYISWFDSDDLMVSDKLEITVNYLEQNNIDCIIHNFNYFRLNEYVRDPHNNFGKCTDLLQAYLSGDVILNFQSILWKRNAIRLEYLNSHLNYAEDVYFITNHIALPGFKYTMDKRALTQIRKHDYSLTAFSKKRPLPLIENEIYVRQKFWKRFRKENHELAKGTLKMYLKSIKPLLHVGEFRIFYKRIFVVFKHEGLRHNLLIPKLIILSLGHILFKRGITLYKNLVNNI